MSKFVGYYPVGSLTTVRGLMSLLEKCRRENTEIVLWSVGQGGSLQSHILTPDSRFTENPNRDGHLGYLCSGPQFDEVTCWDTYGDPNCLREEWMWNYILMGSYNLVSPQDNASGVHRIFVDKQLAENYAEELKNDAEYMEEVRQHRASSLDLDEIMFDLETLRDEELESKIFVIGGKNVSPIQVGCICSEEP